MDKQIPTHDNTKDKQTLILEAALKAYASHGIVQTTTRQIAEIAGIGKSTIFEYFRSKDDLQNAAFQYLISGMAKEHDNIHRVAIHDPVKALHCYIDSAIHMALNNPSLLLLISQYSLGFLLKADKFETAQEEYNCKMHTIMQSLTDEFRFILHQGIKMQVFHLAYAIPLEGLIYTIGALMREIQAQAFLHSKEELTKICEVIKETITSLLGIANTKEG